MPSRSCISVTKCQGTGNDFVLYDARRKAIGALPELARFLCDRQRGVGADGLLVISAAADKTCDLQMRIFNADGSEAEMCGNGVRCVALYARERTAQGAHLRVQTLAGVVETAILSRAGEQLVAAFLEPPVVEQLPEGGCERRLYLADEEAASCRVSMGNPHVVVFTTQDPAAVDLAAIAKQIGQAPLSKAPPSAQPRKAPASAQPRKAHVPGPLLEITAGAPQSARTPNVEVARVASDAIYMRVWERGVGETRACGTGACAVAAAAIATGRSRSPVRVSSKGGEVKIQWPAPRERISLTGAAAIVFDAQVELSQTLSAASQAP